MASAAVAAVALRAKTAMGPLAAQPPPAARAALAAAAAETAGAVTHPSARAEITLKDLAAAQAAAALGGMAAVAAVAPLLDPERLEPSALTYSRQSEAAAVLALAVAT
jgi:hypothetical protein